MEDKGRSRKGGGARRGVSSGLMAGVVDVPPWDSSVGRGGVSRTSTWPISSSSGVTAVLSRLAVASRVFNRF
jgi:hypothetical protein